MSKVLVCDRPLKKAKGSSSLDKVAQQREQEALRPEKDRHRQACVPSRLGGKASHGHLVVGQL